MKKKCIVALVLAAALASQPAWAFAAGSASSSGSDGSGSISSSSSSSNKALQALSPTPQYLYHLLVSRLQAPQPVQAQQAVPLALQ